ncbi:Class II abasic (AP) endonuclease [Maudiozyma exigua]|uniref:DNA-(apurinic or apyrimidinic site) endonuclease 2 n=1 Tax=Maudiozyma exigua TaxID=34358 RepID=A0A9P6W048_MAUEX|nr:Class II abasic (AP) endonuclease [Kazachstania exigua]
MTDVTEEKVKRKANNDLIRFVTFNVNGVRTFFHYHPFSQMRSSLKEVFNYFDADIISFQELKTDVLSISKWGKIDGFYSFISIPKVKKGYSGVGCWIRMLPENHPYHNAMKIIKAEEGITGLLSVKSSRSKVRYRDDKQLGLGGYDNLGITDEERLLKLDSEGRCVMVELACNLIVISVYSPANSGLTEEGESFRMDFIKVLFNRIRNFNKMGKKIAFMGDINICRDLIDSADCLNNANINLNTNNTGSIVEEKYHNDSVVFILNPQTPHRRLLNQLLSDCIIPELAEEGILIDSTRQIQGRDRLKMYTVWNTLKNTRPSNYGSRIDLILITDDIKDHIKDSDILANVMGSDHCPVYTDISLKSLSREVTLGDYKIPRFEARYRYNLQNHNVLSMFAKRSKTTPNTISESDSSSKGSSQSTTPTSSFPSHNTSKNVAANRTKSIDKFFKVTKVQSARTKSSMPNSKEDSGITLHTTKISRNEEGFKPMKDVFGKPPLCNHGDQCILKTSRTTENPGKKFWACDKPRGEPNDPNASCGYFEWV